MSFTARLLAAALAVVTLPGERVEAMPPDSTCATPSHRAFDFWVGEWVVRDSSGEELGRNRVRRVAGGCAILESWTSARGSNGTSLNFYDPDTDRWTQVWVGESGVRLRLQGTRRGESMVLRGTRTRGDTTVHDRITWTPLDDGTVQQRWDVSTDGERSWRTAWVGLYHAASAGETMGSPPPTWTAGTPEPTLESALRSPRSPPPDSW